MDESPGLLGGPPAVPPQSPTLTGSLGSSKSTRASGNSPLMLATRAARLTSASNEGWEYKSAKSATPVAPPGVPPGKTQPPNRHPVRKAEDWLRSKLTPDEESLLDLFTFFVSWNMQTNRPRLMVDPAGSYLESLWIA